MANTVNVLGLQIDVATGDKQHNLKHVESLLRQQCSNKIDLVVLPELFTTGYPPAQIRSLSETKSDKTIETISNWASQYQTNIVAGSIVERNGGSIYNTSFIFDRRGVVVGSYSKTHLFSPIRENDYFDHGSEVRTFDLDIGRLGCEICYDLRFPELSRKLALKNIDMLVIPSAFPSERIRHWKTLCLARAIENQVFVIALNRSGHDDSADYGGYSIVVDPWGNILYEAGAEEEAFSCELEMSSLAIIRSKIPVYDDRRPEVYY